MSRQYFKITGFTSSTLRTPILSNLQFCRSLVYFLFCHALHSVKKMGEEGTGGASDIVKAESTGEDPKATGGLISNLPHPRVNKIK